MVGLIRFIFYSFFKHWFINSFFVRSPKDDEISGNLSNSRNQTTLEALSEALKIKVIYY